MKIAQSPQYRPPPFGTLERETLSSRFLGAQLGDIVSFAIPFVFVIAGFLLLLYLLYGGYRYLFSGGDPKSIQEAKGVITTALLGFAIIFVSYWIVQLFGTIFGLDVFGAIF